METWRRWQRPWSALLAGSLTLWAGLGRAQTQNPACDPGDPKSCAQAVTEGSPAPYSGVLLTPRRAAIVTVRAEQCREQIALEVGAAQELAQVKLDHAQALRVSDQEAHTAELQAMQKGWEDYEERFGPRWYDHPALWVTVGVGLTVALIAGAVAVLRALQPNQPLVIAP